MKEFHILTIFPAILDSYIKESILKRAIAGKILRIKFHDIRKHTTDKHRTVDDTPYGGGPGMVMKVEPIYKALKKIKLFPSKKTSRIILLSPRGNTFDATHAKRLSKYNTLTFICGRYEAIDERVADNIADEIISIGDYTLSGGELPAMVMIESIARFIPGVIGKMESVTKDDVAQYTKPEIFLPPGNHIKGKAWKVPAVLLSGNHANIVAWRNKTTKK